MVVGGASACAPAHARAPGSTMPDALDRMKASELADAIADATPVLRVPPECGAGVAENLARLGDHLAILHAALADIPSGEPR